MKKFSPEDLNPNLTERMRLNVADVVLKWADYDTQVSFWLTLAFGLPMDATSILIGNMDTRNKLDKLIALYAHFGHTEIAKGIQAMCKHHKTHVEVRNAIAHRRCAGCLHSDPDYLAFTSIRHVKGSPGDFEILLIPLSDMKKSAQFAHEAEKRIREITDSMTGPIAKSRPPYAEGF